MRNQSVLLPLFALISLLLALPALSGAQSIDSVQQEMDAFKASGDHDLAPQTLLRAEQYLGAARLAAEQQKNEDKLAALKIASEKMAEARLTASDFRKQNQDLLSLRDDAVESVQMVSAAEQSAGEFSSQQLLNEANQSFNLAILSRERGDLSKSQQQIGQAQQLYTRALDASLPRLSELAASAIGSAASSGAKRYAPVIYQTAKDKLAELRAYIDGINDSPPSRPGEALKLGREAKWLTGQVKLLRKNSGSHEEMLLKSRDFSLRMAGVLGLKTTDHPLLFDMSNRDLLTAAAKLKQDVAAERKAHQLEIEALKIQFEEDLQARLLAQTDELKQSQKNQLSDMKDAFRAKLERETYEKKRQDKLRSLFKKDEADILINLDGSLLVRLTSLQFASAKSKLETKYYDMLSRLKNALQIYSDRNVRIEGHTDDSGGIKPNQILSLKRAESVREFLIAAGVDGARLKALGYGEVRPIASNAFPQGRAMNRRIDIVIGAPK
ncbi:peptidoglycan-binding protein ArfA [Mariprofundus micogutta]|uniref:Peptidoglycan-binding protein ArfA n=1 Tax=Mariprofundus micogutta TaxID=1921010 RepID=A0A1L8CKA3_9PROT|nr:OmpA family protein [Mariprofundus micogutta]GAV19330.1 peptidoglycan-binding protein ArfA [Mariprofundus micogutta]